MKTMPSRRFLRAALTAALGIAVTVSAQERNREEDVFANQECPAFGPKRAKFRRSGLPASLDMRVASLSSLTSDVAAKIAASGGSASATLPPQADAAANLIDTHIFAALAEKNVKPAPATTDWEFIRRLTLDLTGRVPTPSRVISFVNDADPAKRTKLVTELLAKPEWIDKWTMFFGDLYQNNSSNTQMRRFPSGVMAFNKWIRDSLTANKPYDQMARELIAATTQNSYTDGDANWMVGGWVSGGPIQDIWDKQTANVAETFLGISHMDCLLCHNGRGHLDALSLWGRGVTRQQAWGMAAFMSSTRTSKARVNAVSPVPYYWTVEEDARLRVNYALNTTTGNRPERQPIGDIRNVTAEYIFGARKPNAGENPRTALGRFVTEDFQFARATVNYMWEAFFGVGLVNPTNQFDPMRLDPDNPPGDCPRGTPCELQPSNPRLLNALAQYFIDSKYDVKALQTLLVSSRAYQLSSRYDGEWNPTWTTLFARKMVRRMWAEEVHDAIAQTSAVATNYPLRTYLPEGQSIQWAMQTPEHGTTPDNGGAVSRFLDSFYRGDRDEEDRRPDGSLSQALNLMNDSFVMSRVRSNAQGGLLSRYINSVDDSLVDGLFLNVLSRYPSAAEKTAALGNLKAGNRTQEAENLLWSLYNKVDFIFNY